MSNGYVDDPTRQCEGKYKFSTKQRAKLYLRRARQMARRGDIAPYLCPHCDYFHLGTKPGVKKRRRAIAREMRYTQSNATTGGGEGENST